jgi:hypothetical protein
MISSREGGEIREGNGQSQSREGRGRGSREGKAKHETDRHRISHNVRELAQHSLDAQFQADFPLEGRFVKVPVKGKDYWYFDLPTPEGDKRRYVGPHSDQEVTKRVQAHKEIKDDLRERRRLVGTLKRSAGLQGPDTFAGDTTKALAEAGLFRLRAVLIGSVAFSTYAGLLGVRLPSSAMQTGDGDFAQDFAISAEVGDSLPPVLEVLQSVDRSFHAVTHHADKAKVVSFQNAKGYRVEFLTGNRGSDDHTGKPSPMPALGVASAENLRVLDYLIYEPVRTVLLHREGVSVIVPAPERYAVHKLIVASRRLTDAIGRAKRDKEPPASLAALTGARGDPPRRHACRCLH